MTDTLKNNTPENEAHSQEAKKDSASTDTVASKHDAFDTGLDIKNIMVPSAVKFPLSEEKIKLKSDSGSSADNDLRELLEEAVEDNLVLQEKMQQLERMLAAANSRIIAMHETMTNAYRSHSIDLQKLREELLSERKAFLGKNTFNAIIPVLDSLIATKAQMDGAAEKLAYDKIGGVVDVLTGILQNIGYSVFTIEEGAKFDPATMECFGHETGAPGVVIRVVAPGYSAGDIVVNPCKVIVGKE